MKQPVEKTQRTGEVSKLLGVSGVTIRHYTEQFSSFLSPGATSETNRRFTSEDVNVLKLAFSLLREGYGYEETRNQLKERLPVEGEVFGSGSDPDPDRADQDQEPAPATNSIQPVEFFLKFADQLREEHRTTLQAKDETIETLKEDKKRLQAEIDFLRQPFFVRWFKKP